MLTYGFYNSVNGDRKYNAIQLSSIFDGIIRDGVFATIGTSLIVTAAGGMNVTVGIGRAWFNHTWTNNDALLPLTVAQSEIVLNRKDMVVLEVNTNDAVRANTIKIIKGIPASSPVAPTLSAGPFIWQYPLAEIYVGGGVTSITADKITNKVGSAATPFVSGILQTLDVSNLLTQWDAAYQAWLADIDVESGALMTTINTQFQTLLAEKDSEADAQLAANGAEFENWFSSLIAIIDDNVVANLTSRVVLLEGKDVEIEASIASLEATSPELPLKASTFEPTYTSGKLTGGVTKVNGVKRKEEIITYSGNNVSTLVTKIYAEDGVTVVDQTTDTVTYTSGVFTKDTRVVNI